MASSADRYDIEVNDMSDESAADTAWDMAQSDAEGAFVSTGQSQVVDFNYGDVMSEAMSGLRRMAASGAGAVSSSFTT